MRSIAARIVVISGVVVATASAQNQPAPEAGTDVYHVHFTKAAPGQAVALGKALVVPDQSAKMPDHFVVLRHQEGDDWDYAVIQHLGQKAEVTGAPAAPNAARDLRVWHNDTFVSGPSWAEFTRQMGIGGSASAANPVYVVGVHRALPAHREQLAKALNAPGPPSSKIPTGNVVLQHLEGSDWTFMALTRYNSWQDFAAERAEASAATASNPGGWSEIREHSAFHRDTVADRLFPAK
jgi:hypothetical protein